MKMLLAFAATGMLLVGCGKNSGTATSQNEQGDVTFGYSVVNPSAARAVSNIGAVSKILLSVKDENDSLHYDNYKVDVVNFNGKLVSKSLALNTGYNYNLTQFILLNNADSALYATPMAGSKNAPLVNAPLPIAFTVGTSPVSLNPEVLPVVDQNPADFGFFNFNSSIVNVDMFNVAVFAYNSATGVNDLVDAELAISNSSGTIITNSLDAATNVVMYKSDEDTLTLTVKKAGFSDYTMAITKAELANYEKMPLAITLIQPIPSNDLLAHYTFNGDFTDQSGLGNDATGEAGAVLGAGLSGDAVVFDGVDDHLLMKPFDITTNTITMAGWVNLDGVPDNNGAIFFHRNSKNQYGGIQVKNNELRLFWHERGNIWATKTSLTISTDNEWEFVALVVSPTEATIYLNDKSYTFTGPFNPIEFTSELTVGYDNHPTFNRYIKGAVDDVRVYKRNLSATEVAALYREHK